MPTRTAFVITDGGLASAKAAEALRAGFRWPDRPSRRGGPPPLRAPAVTDAIQDLIRSGHVADQARLTDPCGTPGSSGHSVLDGRVGRKSRSSSPC